jgi:hypothetical protein
MALIALALVITKAASVQAWQGTFSFPGLVPGTWLAHNISIHISVDTNTTATVEWTWAVLSDGSKCVQQKESGLKVITEGQQWFARGTGAGSKYYSLVTNLTNGDTGMQSTTSLSRCKLMFPAAARAGWILCWGGVFQTRSTWPTLWRTHACGAYMPSHTDCSKSTRPRTLTASTRPRKATRRTCTPRTRLHLTVGT